MGNKKSANELYTSLFGYNKPIQEVSKDQYQEILDFLPEDFKERIIMPEHRRKKDA
jgi:hypothetical protein